MTDSRLSRIGLQTLLTQAAADEAARLSRIGSQALLTQPGSEISGRLSRIGWQVMVRTERQGWDIISLAP